MYKKIVSTLFVSTLLLIGTSAQLKAATDPTGYVFNTNLRPGTKHPDVQKLQIALNHLGFTIATSGTGSPGNETTFFGPGTRRALIRFQEAHKDSILTPNGLTTGNGLLFASTRNKLNSLLATHEDHDHDKITATLFQNNSGSTTPVTNTTTGSTATAGTVTTQTGGTSSNTSGQVTQVQTAEMKKVTIGTPANGTITANGISCPGDCTENYTAYTNVTFTAKPNAGYTVGKWWGSCFGSTGNTCTVTMHHDPWISVDFVPLTNASAPINGVCGKPADIEKSITNISSDLCSAGNVYTSTQSSSSTYSWQCTGINSGQTATCSAPRTSAAQSSYTLTLTKPTGGTITGSGLVCGTNGATCSNLFSSGTRTALYADAASGYTFSGWTGACSSYGTQRVCEVTLTSNLTVGATFTSSGTGTPIDPITITKKLTVQTPVGGTITGSQISCGSQCVRDIQLGQSIVLTQTPQSGFTFTGWTGACTGTQSTCTVSMSDNRTVGATYTASTPTTKRLTVQSPTGGTITGTQISCGTQCTRDVPSGERITLTATAQTGYVFGGWSGACSGTQSTCSVTVVDAITVGAVFNMDHSGGGMTGMTYVNPNLIPAASTLGKNFVDVAYTGELGKPLVGSGDVAAFRSVCGYSHFNFDDPIVYPGGQNKSHLHVFFGNTSTNYLTTPESLPLTGGSTCRGGTLNRSAYWTPALIDTTTGAPIVPTEMHIYYKAGYQGVSSNSIKVIPKGLRIIAGDANDTTASEWWSEYAYYWCGNGSQGSSTIPSCSPSTFMEMRIKFPQCWDGVNLDSTNHKSHMAYGTGNGCPSTHPYAIPEIQINVRYPGGDASKWRLSSDKNGAPAGTSLHADWMNGWTGEKAGEYIPDVWTRELLNKNLDGGSHILGDGRIMR